MLNEILLKGCKAMDIPLADSALFKLNQYYKMLLEWNQKMNLTAITSQEEVAEKHFLDSITPLSQGDQWIPQEASLIDIGTGAGFPAVPLKIVRPDLKLTLLDSLQKRTIFLQQLTRHLELGQAQIYHGRAEDFGKKEEFREKYDIAVARAVAELNVLLELALPFVKVGGIFIAYKGPGVTEEIKKCEKALEILGGICQEIVTIDIPGSNLNHTLTIIRKIKQTPTNYPRKAGKPEKSPLI